MVSRPVWVEDLVVSHWALTVSALFFIFGSCRVVLGAIGRLRIWHRQLCLPMKW